MKIDRVIFCLNNNPLYKDYWNAVSKVWSKKYNIIPTLAYVGSKEEANALNNEFGEVYQIDPTAKNDKWEVTWALFYVATLFPDDICMTSGIDQIPLGSKLLFDAVDEVDDDKLFVAFANAYQLQSHRPHSDWHPSSHLVAKGSVYKKIFGIGDSFATEIQKITDYFDGSPTWGADEIYSGKFIKDNEDVVLGTLFKEWDSRRIARSRELNYDLEKLKNGEYSEAHLPRPYAENKEYIDGLVERILL